MERLVSARGELLLEGPPTADADPIGFLLGVAETTRLGEPAAPLASAVARAAESVGRGRASASPWEATLALWAASTVLALGGEVVAARDAARLASASRPCGPRPPEPPADAARFAAWLLSALVVATEGGAQLAAAPSPAWIGHSLEAHRVAVPRGEVSFALRWHGERPALLWRAEPAVALSCGVDSTWRSDAPSGEALLSPAPGEPHEDR